MQLLVLYTGLFCLQMINKVKTYFLDCWPYCPTETNKDILCNTLIYMMEAAVLLLLMPECTVEIFFFTCSYCSFKAPNMVLCRVCCSVSGLQTSDNFNSTQTNIKSFNAPLKDYLLYKKQRRISFQWTNAFSDPSLSICWMGWITGYTTYIR